jgi:hypothetical protein
VNRLAQERNPVIHLLGFLGPLFVRKVAVGVVFGEKVAGDIGQARYTGLFAFAGDVEEDRETGVRACIVVFDVFDAVDEVDATGLSVLLVLSDCGGG